MPLCKLLKTSNHLCCLELDKPCEHKTCKQASDYKWKNKCVILATDYATNGLYSFLLPLRAHFRNDDHLKPIVLMLKQRCLKLYQLISRLNLNSIFYLRPPIDFLESISCFPYVYWICGSITE